MSKSIFQGLRWVKPTGKAASKKRAGSALTPTADPQRAAALRAMILDTGLPEATELSVVEETRLLLRVAAEVEQSLLVQYLYAAYSIQGSGAAGGHQRALVKIAVEEMGHLLTLQNLLLAVGAAPYFGREQTLIGTIPAGDLPFPLRLEPLTPDSLSKYVTAESPMPSYIPDAALRARVEAIAAQAEKAAGQPLHHVGALYAKLFWLFQPTDDPHPLWPELPNEILLEHGEGRHLTTEDLQAVADPASEMRQAQPVEFFREPVDPPNGDNLYIIPVHSRIEALFALDQIAEQGEGFKLGVASHFERFLTLYDRFAADLAGHIAPVAINPRTSQASGNQTLITHPAALLWAKLCNARYEMALLKLALGLQQRRDSSLSGVLNRAALFGAAVSVEMQDGVREGAKRLAAYASQGVAAGAPFELPDTPFPIEDADIRQRLRTLIPETALLIQALLDLTGPDALTAVEGTRVGNLRAADAELLAALNA